MNKKEENILEQLFDGRIFPEESLCLNNPEYHKVNKAFNKEKDRLLKLVPDSDFQTFSTMEDLHNKLCNIFGFEGFVTGYKLGIKLLFEALKRSDESETSEKLNQ